LQAEDWRALDGFGIKKFETFVDLYLNVGKEVEFW
jgi:hypothetical protein